MKNRLTEDSRQIIKDMYKLYRAGRIPEAVERLAEDVDWAIMAPKHLFAFAGQRTGRTHVLEALQALLVTRGKHTHAGHIAVVNDSVQLYPFRAAQ